jgi:soluble lytic murein transglycosylase-like protein
VAAASQTTGLPERLIATLIAGESAFKPDAVSKTGALGLTQLMPDTAKALGVNPHNVAENVMGGARYLAQQIVHFNGNLPLAFAAYNAGPGAVEKYGGIPPFPETQAYVQNMMAMYGGGR